LQQLATNTANVYGIKCRFGFEVPVLISDNTAATHLYRIAQEAVNNAVKHANPQTIDIQLAFRDPHVMLTVTDDGSGIATRTSEASSGMGRHIMTSRAAAIGATLEIKSGVRGGTVVVVTYRGGAPGRRKSDANE
jgi:two-component system sensor kinase FixL